MTLDQDIDRLKGEIATIKAWKARMVAAVEYMKRVTKLKKRRAQAKKRGGDGVCAADG